MKSIRLAKDKKILTASHEIEERNVFFRFGERLTNKLCSQHLQALEEKYAVLITKNLSCEKHE